MPETSLRRLKRSARPQVRETRATVTTIQVDRPPESASRQIAYLDEFHDLATALQGVYLPTPYDVPTMFGIIERSNMIPQCVEAFVTNTVLAGWEVGTSQRAEAIKPAEEHELQSFIDHANSEESLATVLEKAIRNRESVGFGFTEIIRDIGGSISLLRDAPARNTRLAPKHPTDVLVSYDIARGRRVSTVQEWRKFRKYVQVVNGRYIWFREFGDPRRMDYRNGAFEGETNYDPRFPATEIYHWRLPSNDPYGVPRWISQLPNIIGSREAEEVNMRYFQDNTVPPMLLTVAGGRLTAGSHRELSNALNIGAGRDRQNKILLLEAVGEGDSLDNRSNTVSLNVEKLADQRQSDGLFDKYDASNMAKIRSCWRLPPVSVGMSQDMTFATASVSAFVAESQVFAPERVKIDEVLNKLIVNGKSGLGLTSAILVSRTPAITSPEMVLKTLTALNVIGSVTPRSAQSIVNKMLQIEIDPYPRVGEAGYEPWMDRPMILETGKQKSHEEQAQKDAATKATEEDGDIGQQAPKNGNQTSAMT